MASYFLKKNSPFKTVEANGKTTSRTDATGEVTSSSSEQTADPARPAIEKQSSETAVSMVTPSPQEGETSGVVCSPEQTEDPPSYDRNSVARSTYENIDNAVAIVGIAAITPGAENIRDFWRLLKNGESHITDVPASRWHIDAFYDSDPLKPGTAYVRKAGFVKDAEKFDNAFFGISEYEAASMDPQQSLLLECTYRALENGGITHISGTNTGVFVGAMTSDHAVFYPAGSPEVDSYTATGVSSSMLAARVSYVYNLLGPSMVIDTACSSSLVAIHQGIQAIKNGDCGMAICGGVNYIGAPTMFVQLSKTKMLSPTGQSRAFSADADGYVRGEGCGIVVLKRLKDALDNNDRIWATVVSGVNQDGHTVTPVTAPSGTQQEKLMTDIYTKYSVDVSRLDYIEAHGTGTQAGDPVEVKALGKFLKAMGQPRTRYIGSVKTNIGHLEAAAGVIGVIKVLLMMKHDTIVPSLHCKELNPLIDLDNLGLIIPQSLVSWENEDKMACCNSFGFGGTNSHVVLKAYNKKCLNPVKSSINVVCFSGKSEQALRGSMATLREVESLGTSDAIKDQQNEESLLTSVAYTSSVRRDHYSFRKAYAVDGVQDLFQIVSQSINEGLALQPAILRHVVFVFCGMGTTRPGMCKQMMEEFPFFQETILKIDAILADISKENPWSLVNNLSKEAPTDDPVFSPIAIFACQVALVALWESLGVSPDCVVGQSVGEVAAAYTAGCLSLETAVKIIYFRSKILSQSVGGKMMVVKNISVEKVREILREFDKASIALEYSPLACAVSADSDIMTKIQKRLAPHLYSGKQRVQMIPLNVPVAYHSQFVESCQEQLSRALENLEATPPKTSYISAVTSEKMTSAPGQGYWVNHLREPVLFHKAVQAARKQSPTNTVFLEIGPKSVLKTHMADIFPTEDVPLIESMHKPPEKNFFLKSVTSLYELGVDVKWAALYKGCHDIVDAPRYAFDKKVHLKPTTEHALIASGTGKVNHHLFVFPISSTKTFKIFLSTSTTSFVYDHTVSSKIIVPGALYLEAGLAIASRSRYDPTYQPVVSATFVSPLSAKKDEFLELDVRAGEMSGETVDQLQLSVRKDERDIAHIHIEWRPVTHAGQGIINLQHICDKCPVFVKKSDIYFSLKRLGFDYGQTFALLEKVYRGEGECLAHINVISKVAKDFVSTTIHPCVLDAMFQSVAILSSGKGTGDLQFLPKEVKGLKVFSELKTLMFVHSRLLRDEGKRISYKLTLLSQNGLVLATVDELALIRINMEDHSGLPMTMAMKWIRVCNTWGADLHLSEDAFILHTEARPDRSDVKNVKTIRLTDQAKVWDEIHEEVTTLMEGASQAPAIVVVCHTQVSEDMTCDDLDTMMLNTCGAVHSVLRLARDLNYVMPVYICTYGAWPKVETSVDHIQVSPAATGVWGMMRTAQGEHVYPSLVTVDLHIPATHVTSTFLSLMAQSLSNRREFRDNSEFLITAEAVYVNRVTRIDKHTSVPSLRHVPLDLDENFLVVTEDAEAALQPFAVKVSAPVDLDTSNVLINSFLFALPSPSLTKATMIYNEDTGGSKQYSVFALETVGRRVQEDDEVTVACCLTQAGSRISVPSDTTVPASLMPGYRLGDLTKLVLLFALSEKVCAGDVTILTSESHVGLARVLKMKLESKERRVTIAESRNLKSVTIQSETVISFFLLDCDVTSALVKRWSKAKSLVTCDALLTSEAVTYLTAVCPKVEIESVDTQLLFRPLTLALIVADVKDWLTEKDKDTLACIFGHLHFLKNSDATNSEFDGSVDRLNNMLTFTELMPGTMFAKVDSQNMFDGNSVYIVVGGLTGLGWICVKFLARHGARNIAIIQRRTPSAKHCSNIEEISNQFHCNIRVFHADVTSRRSTQEALSSVGKSFVNTPLKGIFFGAAILDDAPFSSMNRDKFDKALAPKVKGAWNFHLLTKHLPLDYFVMHSSATSVLGNHGQANYAAGNAFLDGLAYFRRHLGLSAQSFSWGPLLTGLLENNEKVQHKLESLGFLLMTEKEIDESLSPLLMLNWPHCGPMKMDKNRYLDRLKASELGHLQRFQFSASPDVDPTTFDMHHNFSAAQTKDPAARLEVYRSYIRQLASRVLTVDQSLVTLDTNLANFGLDSVSSTMIIDQIFRDTNIRLSAVTLISSEVTVRTIAQVLTDNSSS